MNPRYTVHAVAPPAAFFRKVREIQGSWLRTCRLSMHNRGLREEARKLERQGRRVALVEFESIKAGEAHHERPPEVLLLSDLTEAERREAVQCGQLAKQAAFSGLMFIDGALIAPRTWQSQADKLLATTPASTIIKTHRHLDLAALQSNDDLDHLRLIAQAALQSHLAAHPTYVAFITPHVTISAPTAAVSFYRKAEHAQAQWSILLKRTLGNGNYRRAHRSADPVSYALVFGGILFAVGQLFWPGCWPNQALKPSTLKRSSHPDRRPELLRPVHVAGREVSCQNKGPAGSVIDADSKRPDSAERLLQGSHCLDSSLRVTTKSTTFQNSLMRAARTSRPAVPYPCSPSHFL
ncbi:hypothetical protein SAMN05444166_7326 [Singulisphaera sp. GP187]|nr:hypothetical protein SAMN05444166_7326 [Singulisphaera sp. GP187]